MSTAKSIDKIIEGISAGTLLASDYLNHPNKRLINFLYENNGRLLSDRHFIRFWSFHYDVLSGREK